MDHDDSEPDAAMPAPFDDDGEGLLTGTPAFEALFAALENAVPLADPVSLGLQLGSNFAAFG